MALTIDVKDLAPVLETEANVYGRNYQRVDVLPRSTTTSAAFVLVPGVTLTTPALTGTYRVAYGCLVDHTLISNKTEVRLRNTTDAVNVPAVADTEVPRIEPKDTTNRYTVTQSAEVVFTGAAKTFEMQFRQQGGGTSGVRVAYIEIWRVA